MRAFYTFVYLYLLLKPFYIFKSGSIQLGDIFIVLSFILMLILSRKDKGLKTIINENKLFIFFVILVNMINAIYFLIFYEVRFLLSSLYFIFNTFAIIVFIYACENNNNFLFNISKIFKFNLLIQLIICILNLGKVYGDYRYMGTFNDPNQFGYYILLSYSYLYLINLNGKKVKNIFLYLLICIYLIFKCSSTGMLLGISIFIILDVIKILLNLKKYILKYKTQIFMAFVMILLVSVVFLIAFSDKENEFKNAFSNIHLIDRVIEKINRIDNTNYQTHVGSEMNLWQERGYDKIFFYPQYILFGAGEGKFNRFEKAAHMSEIHATFPSILFYYGIIPFTILLRWIIKKLKNLKKGALAVYIALFVESFTLLNQRQALFWTIIVLNSFLVREEKNEKDEKNAICS